MPVITNGPIFSGFKRILRDVQRKPLSPETETCSREIVEELLAQRTTNERPGMLLGRIQSGKTRAFVGATAIAFDSGFDMAIVLTKGTVALTKQTVARLRSDLSDSVQPREVIVEDIRHLPDPLEPWEQNRKIIFICKKETRNLQRLGDVMLRTYPHFATRRVLVIDDEADNASIGYQRRDGVLDLRVIPGHIDELRTGLGDNAFYLQVTATPQALYLQPININISGRPPVRQVRPIFTKTVPLHPNYIGGREYFEESRRTGTTESFLHVPFPQTELDALIQENRAIFEIENVLTAPAVETLRRALVTFVVAGILRQLQQADGGQHAELYSFIVHTATRTNTHRWQDRVARELIRQLQESARANIRLIQPLIEGAYTDLRASLAAEGLDAPLLDRVLQSVDTALNSMMVTTVNGTRDIEALLDETGQLRLRTPYNVFIGGQILDRGLTIDNLIGFYYGRAPQRAQEDTTQQHCRMYGNRPRSDLAVTRFYTTPTIYQRMRGIHERDEALWQTIARGEMDPDRVFLHADATGQTRPCGLQKIAASQVTTLRAGRELLPVGFTTTAARHVKAAVSQLDELVAGRHGQPFNVNVEVAIEMIDLARRMVHMDRGEVFDWKAMKAAVRLLAQQHPIARRRDRVVCLVRSGVNYNKFRLDRGIQRLQNEPHGYNDPATVRQFAGPSPGLILLRQLGSPDDNWSGEPFYWPILVIPNNVPPRLFSEENE
jgi:Z1 domain-containing protein